LARSAPALTFATCGQAQTGRDHRGLPAVSSFVVSDCVGAWSVFTHD
jgi:hypothetical protein